MGSSILPRARRAKGQGGEGLRLIEEQPQPGQKLTLFINALKI